MLSISKKYIYRHSWEYVTTALWDKYPNDLQPHVKRVDILNFELQKENKLLNVKRLYSLKYNLPSVLQKIIGNVLNGFAIDEINCDFSGKKLTMKGMNYTLKNMFLITEVCNFQVHPENANWTLFTQDITFGFNELKSKFKIFSKSIEKATIKSLNEKSHHGLKVMNQRIEQIKLIFEKDICKNACEIETPCFLS